VTWQLPLLRASALFCFASGGLLLAYWYLYVVFMPYRDLSTTLSILALHKHWTWINVLGVAGAAAGLLALPGIYLRQAEQVGALGLWGFLLALLGSALLLGPMLWDTILWSPLAHHDPSILDFKGPIYTSRAFVPFFVTAGLLWAAGMAMLGWATFQAGVLPRWGGLLLVVGAPLFGLGSLLGPLQVYPRTVGITAFAAGLIWLGLGLRATP
jgi:hypothetical protein